MIHEGQENSKAMVTATDTKNQPVVVVASTEYDAVRPTYNRKTISVLRAGSSGITQATDEISAEVPVALVYNGISHVILMVTPADLKELVLGFSLTEGIISSIDQIYDIEVEDQSEGVVLNIEIASGAFQRLKGRHRNMSGRTGCGLCGLDSLAAVKPKLSLVRREQPVKLPSILKALAEFDGRQTLRAITGSVHGVAWANMDGQIQAVFEDVGRHNALDKLIGWCLTHNIKGTEGLVLISSRASFEMVVKTSAAGIGCLVAVSAPTSYAIELAEQANMTLIGRAAEKRQIIFSHPEFIEI